MDILNIMVIVRCLKGGRGGYPWRRRGDNATGYVAEKFFTKSASLAQLAEHLFCKQTVAGSNPAGGSMIFRLVRSISGFRYDQKHMIREVPSGRGWAKSCSVGWSPTIGGRARMLEMSGGIAHA
jgi:hypothetical protein